MALSGIPRGAKTALYASNFKPLFASMKKVLMLLFAVGVLLTGCATSNNTSQGYKDEEFRNEEPVVNNKLNNRRLEKNMDRYADELQLTKRQQKQLKKIDRRYARMERKMSRRDDTKRRDRKRLAEEKRIEMIGVLTSEQQQTLETLSKKGRFSLDQLFGK
jgi:Spy/CpxP family protein refolding chaperone